MVGHFNDEKPLYDSLCDGTALNDYRLLVEGGRYPRWSGTRAGLPLFARLAAFVVGRGGERRDRPIYELCHLVVALAECGIESEGERLKLFLGLDPVTSATIREAISGHMDEAAPEGISHRNGDGLFFIYYRRAVYLFAVYEFLAQMEGCAYFLELNDILAGILTEGGDETAIRKASNAIARRLNLYRARHFDWQAQAENFNTLTRFLNNGEHGGRWQIDDETVFDFWCSASSSGRYREYRTCFDVVARLIRALDKAARIRNEENRVSFEEDRSAGNRELDSHMTDFWGEPEWTNPISCFDEDPLCGINFFKAASERAPLESLMHYGPQALALTHAFLRLEAFSPVQSGISNDLRLDRGSDSLRRRLDMEDAPTYGEKQSQFEKLMEHVREMMKAVLHVIASSEMSAEVAEEARRTFNKVRRKGFQDLEAQSEKGLEAFRIAASHLPLIYDQLNDLLARIARLGGDAELEQLYRNDRDKFRSQFQELYGRPA